MKLLMLSDQKTKKIRYMAQSVVIAALEKQITCDPVDLSDIIINSKKTGSDDYIRALTDCISREKPDVVLCTGVSTIKLMAAVKHSMKDPPVVCGILSDYSCSPGLYDRGIDCYFVPHEEIRNKLIQSGIEPSRIYVTGIPVKRHFREHIGKAAARNYLVIPKNRRIYMLIPDGLTEDQVIRLCRELSIKEKDDYAVYVPVSRSSEGHDRLLHYASEDRHLRVITYNRQLNLYFESADAVLMKPDPLTSTEAAASGVPIVHLSFDGAGGRHNSDFFARHEMAVMGSSIRDTVSKAIRFVEEQAMAARMIQMQYRNVYADAADKIIEILVRIISHASSSYSLEKQPE